MSLPDFAPILWVPLLLAIVGALVNYSAYVTQAKRCESQAAANSSAIGSFYETELKRALESTRFIGEVKSESRCSYCNTKREGSRCNSCGAPA